MYKIRRTLQLLAKLLDDTSDLGVVVKSPVD